MADESHDFGVSTFLSSFVQGGALSSLFHVEVTSPIATLTNFQFMCKTASFPSSEITANEISYMGRPINIPGNRESQQWTTEVYNDEDHLIRSELLKWMDNINGHSTNKRSTNVIALSSYSGTLSVSQHTKTAAAVTNKVSFFNAWPSAVAEITLDWETNEIQTYEVTWEFSHWSQSAGSIGGDTSDDGS